MGGFPGRGFSNSCTCCVFFAWRSVIAREFLLKIDTSLAIATSGLRTNLLFEKPPPPKTSRSIFPIDRRKTVRNSPSKILYTELLKSWSTLPCQLPPHGKLQGSSLQYHANRNVYQTNSPEFEVGNGKNYQCPQKSFWFLSRSFRREPWHCSADIKGPLSVNLPELPIQNSEEFGVGNGKNYPDNPYPLN